MTLLPFQRGQGPHHSATDGPELYLRGKSILLVQPTQ